MIGDLILLAIFGVITGVSDGYGFLHASAIWSDHTFSSNELMKSAFGFFFGIVTYWISLYFIEALGVSSPEVQTLMWFAMVMISVAFVDGSFFSWPSIDKLVALVVIVGLGYLLVKIG